MFGRHRPPLDIPPEDRVILVIGGTGAFGRAVLADIPAHYMIANISRRSALSGPGQITLRFDIVKEPERAFAHAASILPHVDVLVYAAYSREFADIPHIERRRFLHEYETDVFSAMRSLQLAEEYFWRGHNDVNRQRARKGILISSAAALGKTARPELATYSAAKAALNALGPYAHDYLQGSCGVGVAVLAPGSLEELGIRESLAQRFWEIEAAPLEKHVLEVVV